MYYVYILQSQLDKSYYIGQSINIEKRVTEHNSKNTKSIYTKRKRPWFLVYSEEYHTRSEAIKREQYLKRVKNKIYLEKIILSKGP